MKRSKKVILTMFLITALLITGYFTKQKNLMAYDDFYIRKGYTVKSGDTLFLLSKLFGVSVPNIKNANVLTSNTIYPGEILAVPSSKTLKQILIQKNVYNPGDRISILVDKFDHILTVLLDGQAVKTYHVELGDSGLDDKKVSGDHKTPEGTFYISEMSVLSPADQYLGTRWMRLSYPNVEDARRGLRAGSIDSTTYNEIVTAFNLKKTPPQRTALGGGVGIHGGSTLESGNDWTWGCVGLSNKDVEDIYPNVNIGTQVIIKR
jgi:murein L,D-transpeptidase YafK